MPIFENDNYDKDNDVDKNYNDDDNDNELVKILQKRARYHINTFDSDHLIFQGKINDPFYLQNEMNRLRHLRFEFLS